ncbi:MAG TPA: CRISPR-associated endonuclease Cas2 [Paenibacillus sp.]|uniref:CRISPR-associated endonuclease Cas2 n=1 Tax=Paenibacillus sp. TaxID=58172 RepID=UPI0028D34D84|nr:CRISPR-associated endonuclease Cas2 [Paenibacillus sp.]HUC93255.1 CRISPR-associated endonuclease Cas2 [Paenibacillus sp.]
MAKKQYYIVCYDIRDPRRWRKCYKILNGYGERLQYSVFRCSLTEKQLAELRFKLVKEMDAVDNLLIAPIHPEYIKNVFVLNMPEDWDAEKDRFLLF